MLAYLSVWFLVFTISFIVPIKIPFGYIPPSPDVTTASPCKTVALAGILEAFKRSLLLIVPFTNMLSSAVEIVELTADNVLKVRFHGGCVGCSAVGATITDSLQVKLNYHFRDENIKIEDVTEHKVTDNTFQNQ